VAGVEHPELGVGVRIVRVDLQAVRRKVSFCARFSSGSGDRARLDQRREELRRHRLRRAQHPGKTPRERLAHDLGERGGERRELCGLAVEGDVLGAARRRVDVEIGLQRTDPAWVW